MKRFWDKVQKSGNGCWLWMGGKYSDGYGGFNIEGKTFRVHRFSWELINGPIPTGLYVLHKCDTPACVNPKHLFLGSHKDNMDDAKRKKRMNVGINNGSSKLTPEKVKKILRDVRTQRLVAKDYGVSRQLISLIKRKIIWSHII